MKNIVFGALIVMGVMFIVADLLGASDGDDFGAFGMACLAFAFAVDARRERS